MRFTLLASFCFDHRLAMLTIAATLALVGCDDSSTSPADALVGSWVLTDVTRYDSSGQVYEGDYDPYHDSTGQVIFGCKAAQEQSNPVGVQ